MTPTYVIYPCGPRSVNEFEGITGTEEPELLQRDAYKRVNYVLNKLGI
jgi:hypothetical protein